MHPACLVRVDWVVTERRRNVDAPVRFTSCRIFASAPMQQTKSLKFVCNIKGDFVFFSRVYLVYSVQILPYLKPMCLDSIGLLMNSKMKPYWSLLGTECSRSWIMREKEKKIEKCVDNGNKNRIYDEQHLQSIIYTVCMYVVFHLQGYAVLETCILCSPGQYRHWSEAAREETSVRGALDGRFEKNRAAVVL